MSTGTRIPGLASGFDTQGIIDSFMAVQKIPYDKLDIRKQTEEVKLQAYQAVNSLFLKFRTAVNSLSSRTLWNSNAAVSTNEKSITATANEYADKGSYSFRVAQLASAAKFTSRGFSSSKTPLVKQAEGEAPYSLGSITMSSAKTRVDNSAKLDTFNGGKGVFRGQVRITDANNNTSIFDLSAADTIDDVVRTLNTPDKAMINAYVDENGMLAIEDVSGGSGQIRVQNVGTGTTATDLGILGSSGGNLSGEGRALLTGENAYTLGNDMKLSLLNDGLGVEKGIMNFTATNSVGDSASFNVDLSTAETVGDVLTTVNAAIDAYRNSSSDNGVLDGLRFALSEDKTSFTLTGTTANTAYTFGATSGTQGKGDVATSLGIDGRQTTGSAPGDLDYRRVLGAVNSPMLKTLGGANNAGVGAYSEPGEDNTGMVNLPVSGSTPVSTLNGGRGLDISRPLQMRIIDGATGEVHALDQVIDPTRLEAELGTNPDMTLDELLTFMNDEIAQYAKDNDVAALSGVKLEWNGSVGAVGITGTHAGNTYQMLGTVAAAIGIQRMDNGDIDTSIHLDENIPADQAILDKLDDFYNRKSSSPSLVNVNSDIDEESTMADLVGLAGIAYDESYPGGRAQWLADSQAALPAKLNDLFGAGKSFTLATTDTGGNPANITVNWDDVATALGGPVDENTNVQDFMAAVNSTIATAAAAVDPDLIAPEMAISKFGTGFTWSNVDLSRDWAMSGDGMAELNLAKDTGAIFGLNPDGVTRELTMAPDLSPGSISSMTSGYYVEVPLDENTTLDKVNYMAGFQIPGGQSFTIDLGGKGSISVRTDDIIAGLQLASNPPTMGEYTDILNNLVNAALEDTGGPNAGLAAGDPNRVALEFEVTADGIGITGVQNLETIGISGDGPSGSPLGVLALGIPTSNITIGASDDASTQYQLSYITAVDYREQTLSGLGSVFMEDADGNRIELKTDGLSTDSTLNELIAKLNSELENQGISDLSFTLNSTGTGLAVDNQSKRQYTFVQSLDADGNPDNNLLASDLGLIGPDGSPRRVEGQTFDNLGTLNRHIVGRGTLLSDYIGANADKGSIRLTDSTGKTQNVNLLNVETIGDLVDAINLGSSSGFGIYAEINERGDGIILSERWKDGMVPPANERGGTIKVEDIEGGSVAKKLGIAGTGKRDAEGTPAYIDGSKSTSIEVNSDDTLEDLMYRLAESGEYKTAVVNSGTSSSPNYRLTITAVNTGEESDFVISSDVDLLGLNQTSRGKDAKVLYGDPDSGSSPIMLSSATNSNSSALSGMTLDIKSASAEWTTITVDTDKEKVTDEVKNMVSTYNDMIGVITQLDGYDSETGEKGILFGDPAVRDMLETINDHFMQIFNPGNLGMGEQVDGEQAMWTWMDMGVSLSSRNSNTDGSGSWFTTMELDEEALEEMVASNWDALRDMMALERNAANINQGENARPIASFNGGLAEGSSVNNAVNGNISRTGFGTSNGLLAGDTIANGADTFTLTFQKPLTINRLSIYHESSDTALSDFVVEYMDDKGEWVELRKIEGNQADANHMGFADQPTTSAIRIRATKTNADDDTFRLLDVQVIEQAGLAGQLNKTVNMFGDTQTGFLASRDEEVRTNLADLDEQMKRLQERLDAKEEALWRQYTNMETVLGKLQNQSSYFNSMMGTGQ